MLSTPLGAFLRAQRARCDPRAVGLPLRGGRRVTGLRREEVAALAGVSVDYYQRLEQGRDHRPSPQVLEALAGVLGLDPAARLHLFALASADGSRRRSVPGQSFEDPVPTGTLRLLDAVRLPAFVTGRRLDVLASNADARALAPAYMPGRNRLRDLLLEPAERERYSDWDLASERLVAVFRTHVGADVDTPPVASLVTELLQRSDRFRELWEDHRVTARDESPGGVEDSRVNGMVWGRERLVVEGVRGQSLVLFYRLPAASHDEQRGSVRPH